MQNVDVIEYNNGPDQLIPSEVLATTDGSLSVKLRDDGSLKAFPPLSIPTMMKNTVNLYPDAVALTVKREDNGLQRTVEWTFRQYYAHVRMVAKAFIKLGLKRHHSVGIMGFNSPEWFFSILGAIFAGGFGAGIYATNSADISKYILDDCTADILVIENATLLKKILSGKDQIKGLKAVILYSGKVEGDLPNVYSWDELLEIGRKESDSELESRLMKIAINECCALIYTSGTTGLPKGAMLSHDNITWTARSSLNFLGLDHRDVGVSYLPLSHIAAQYLDIWIPLAGGIRISFADKNALKGSLGNTLRETRPTYFFGVPRVFEKMQEKMQEVGRNVKGLRRIVADWAKKVGLNHYNKLSDGLSDESISYPIAKKLIFKKVKQNLGLDRMKICGVGAAPVSRSTLDYFFSLDIPLYECYGMSESGPHLGNRPGQLKIDRCGICMNYATAKINQPDNNGEGELCLNGRNIMMGYMNSLEKTKEAIDEDGWLHSGDIARMDEDGYYKITGRIKELIITAGGENIPPVIIEDCIKQELPMIVSNAMVIGDKKKFLSCLLTVKVEVDPDTLAPTQKLTQEAINWCRSVGSNATTIGEVAKDPNVLNALDKGIERANNKATSNAQKIQKFTILPEDFSIPGGELGPTMKLKRPVVLKKYATKINNFYNS